MNDPTVGVPFSGDQRPLAGGSPVLANVGHSIARRQAPRGRLAGAIETGMNDRPPNQAT
jgi:hypothetical protein